MLLSPRLTCRADTVPGRSADGLMSGEGGGTVGAHLSEPEAKQLARSWGIEVPLGVTAGSVGELVQAARSLRPPFVLKLVSRSVIHKSDVGGVRVRLGDAEEVRRSAEQMLAAAPVGGYVIDGFLLEEMVAGGVEMVIGAANDPLFGPILMAGLGGVYLELLADTAFRICPVGPEEVEEMLRSLRSYPLLEGFRGAPAANLDAVVDVALKIGGPDGIMQAHGGAISAIEINPLIVSADSAVAADVRIMGLGG